MKKSIAFLSILLVWIILLDPVDVWASGSNRQIDVAKRVKPDTRPIYGTEVSEVEIGERLIFQIEVRNLGDELVDTVQVVDVLPLQLRLITTDPVPTQIDRRPEGAGLQWKLDSLTPHQVIVLTYEAEVVIATPEDPSGFAGCVVNVVNLIAGTQLIQTDQVRICSVRQGDVLGATSSLPEAGLADYWVELSSLALLGLAFSLMVVDKAISSKPTGLLKKLG